MRFQAVTALASLAAAVKINTADAQFSTTFAQEFDPSFPLPEAHSLLAYNASTTSQKWPSLDRVADYLLATVDLVKTRYPNDPLVQSFTIVNAIADGVPFTSEEDVVSLLRDANSLGFSFADLDTGEPYTEAQLRSDLEEDLERRVRSLIPDATHCSDFSCFVAILGNAGFTSDKEAFTDAWFVEQIA